MPRLSIVVPFYNVGEYIGDCLSSIARQTFEDFEVVLVDDGSKDDSVEVADRYARDDARFRVVAQENQGLGPARNTGVLHSVGEFVTFVDSDDLVSRHGFEMMIGSLDKTGSSFAAGDARRFNSSGVRESWVHRVPFARQRPATHVLEFPDLILDRMVWNKVYRRSFWNEFGYSFPAIRYEDYPVTLQAHLDAVTVDCLSAAVYYWRERETGESITQQAYEYSNLLDRVVSAEMVMDLVDERAPELRPRVHRHLAEIDLVALVQAFRTVPLGQQDDLIELGHRFTGRLDTRVLANASTYDRLQVHALRAGDIGFLKELAHFRQAGGLRGGARARPRVGMPWRYENQYPGLTARPRPAPRELYRLPDRQLVVHTTVADVRWVAGQLVVRGTAEVRHLPTTSRSTLVITMRGDGIEVPCIVERFETTDSHNEPGLVGFVLRIDEAAFASLPVSDRPLHFHVELRSGRVCRRGVLRSLRAGSPSYPPGRWIDPRVWIQPSRGGDGRLCIKRFDDPWRLSSVAVTDDSFVVSGSLPPDVADAQMILTRSSSASGLLVDLEVTQAGAEVTFTGRIPMAQIIDAANPDDPITQRTSRVMQLVNATSEQYVLATGLRRSVSGVYNSRLLTVTRSPANLVNLNESPLHLVVDEADVDPGPDGPVVTVGGGLWATELAAKFVWRRFITTSDDHLDVACRRTSHDHRWGAAVRLTELLGALPTSGGKQPAAVIDWGLFAIDDEGTARPVASDHFLTGLLPRTIDHGGSTVVIQPRADSFHLEVR